MANKGLTSAKKAKNDEFYTQFHDIEKEMNAYLEYNPEVFKDKTILLPCDDPEWSNFTRYFAQNFEKLQLKKLISTSYAPNSKPREIAYQPTLFEIDSPEFDASKTQSNGKIFTLTKDKSGDGVINFDDLEWSYLEGGGDFRSEEVTRLRDEADFIITNPPFSLFREFFDWVHDGGRKFTIISNKNCVTYKEVFPRIQADEVWPGSTPMGREMLFDAPREIGESLLRSGRDRTWTKVGDEIKARSSSLWLTNIDHGKRHQPLPLMTEADNIKFSKHKQVKDVGYQKYDNYDAIEVPFTDAIPSDYDGIMGVPISFLDKYNPEQFEIIGCSYDFGRPSGWPKDTNMTVSIGGKNVYKRLLIRHKESR
jgi:hypothetical protein